MRNRSRSIVGRASFSQPPPGPEKPVKPPKIPYSVQKEKKYMENLDDLLSSLEERERLLKEEAAQLRLKRRPTIVEQVLAEANHFHPLSPLVLAPNPKLLPLDEGSSSEEMSEFDTETADNHDPLMDPAPELPKKRFTVSNLSSKRIQSPIQSHSRAPSMVPDWLSLSGDHDEDGSRVLDGVRSGDDEPIGDIEGWETPETTLQKLAVVQSMNLRLKGMEDEVPAARSGSANRGSMRDSFRSFVPQYSDAVEEKKAVESRQLRVKDFDKRYESHLKSSNIQTLYLYTQGTGRTCQLGAMYPPIRKKPQLVEMHTRLMTIVDAAVGQSACYVLRCTGEILSWGHGGKGELGSGGGRNLDPVPRRVDCRMPVVQVSARHRHCALVTDKGQLFTWGYGKDYRLGLGADCRDQSIPQMVKELYDKKVLWVSVGYDHAACVVSAANGDDSHVYTWGTGKVGCLGHGKEKLVCKVPTLVENLDPPCLNPRQVHCGAHHTLMLTDDGMIYTCGMSEDGRLGHGDSAQLDTFKRIESLARDDVVAVSASVGFAHNMILDEKGHAFSWGLGHLGQLGHGTTKSKLHPSLITALDGLDIVKINCGPFNSAAVSCCDGRMFLHMWGMGEQYQLGIVEKNITSKSLPTCVPDYIGIDPNIVCCSDDFTLVIASEKEVLPGFAVNKTWKVYQEREAKMLAEKEREAMLKQAALADKAMDRWKLKESLSRVDVSVQEKSTDADIGKKKKPGLPKIRGTMDMGVGGGKLSKVMSLTLCECGRAHSQIMPCYGNSNRNEGLNTLETKSRLRKGRVSPYNAAPVGKNSSRAGSKRSLGMRNASVASMRSSRGSVSVKPEESMEMMEIELDFRSEDTKRLYSLNTDELICEYIGDALLKMKEQAEQKEAETDGGEPETSGEGCDKQGDVVIVEEAGGGDQAEAQEPVHEEGEPEPNGEDVQPDPSEASEGAAADGSAELPMDIEVPGKVGRQPSFVFADGECFKVFDENFYLSGQLSEDEIRGSISGALGVKTVLELRKSTENGFMDHRTTCENEGVAYYHAPTGESDFVPEHIETLLDLLNQCEQPVMICCKSGRRSAAVAVMYSSTYPEKSSMTEAELRLRAEQLGWDFKEDSLIEQCTLEWVTKQMAHETSLEGLLEARTAALVLLEADLLQALDEAYALSRAEIAAAHEALQKATISEIKSACNVKRMSPAALVVLDSVFLLLNDTSYGPRTSELKRSLPEIMLEIHNNQILLYFDREDIFSENIPLLSTLVNNPHFPPVPKDINNVGSGAPGFILSCAAWVLAIYHYAVRVLPIQEKLGNVQVEMQRETKSPPDGECRLTLQIQEGRDLMGKSNYFRLEVITESDKRTGQMLYTEPNVESSPRALGDFDFVIDRAVGDMIKIELWDGNMEDLSDDGRIRDVLLGSAMIRLEGAFSDGFRCEQWVKLQIETGAAPPSEVVSRENSEGEVEPSSENVVENEPLEGVSVGEIFVAMVLGEPTEPPEDEQAEAVPAGQEGGDDGNGARAGGSDIEEELAFSQGSAEHVEEDTAVDTPTE